MCNSGELNGVRLLKESTVDEAVTGYVNQYDHGITSPYIYRYLIACS
jgi:hypothetical protein